MTKKAPSSLKRVIVDYKKLTPEILSMLVEKYPDGYDDDDIITFKNLKNETIEAIELRTDDYIYLVKVSTKLVSQMENFDTDDDPITEDSSLNGVDIISDDDLKEEEEEEEEEE